VDFLDRYLQSLDERLGCGEAERFEVGFFPCFDLVASHPGFHAVAARVHGERFYLGDAPDPR
jgi:hypothetical protein